MTTATTTAPDSSGVRSQGPAAWRLLAAVGFVLGATAFTVQAFVASTSAHAAAPTPVLDPAPECAVQGTCTPFEVTHAACAMPEACLLPDRDPALGGLRNEG